MVIVALGAAKSLSHDKVDENTAKEVHPSKDDGKSMPMESTKKPKVIPIHCIGTLPNGVKYHYKKFKTVKSAEDNQN